MSKDNDKLVRSFNKITGVLNSMSITSTWNIVAMDCRPNVNGMLNYVVTSHWTLTATDGTYTKIGQSNPRTQSHHRHATRTN